MYILESLKNKITFTKDDIIRILIKAVTNNHIHIVDWFYYNLDNEREDIICNISS
jgi:hypothetical protein